MLNDFGIGMSGAKNLIHGIEFEFVVPDSNLHQLIALCATSDECVRGYTTRYDVGFSHFCK